MEQTQLLMSLQLSSPVAWSLVTSVILWSMFLFCGFGVLSGTNPTSIVALACEFRRNPARDSDLMSATVPI